MMQIQIIGKLCWILLQIGGEKNIMIYYCINAFFMLINIVLLCYIKFATFNRSVADKTADLSIFYVFQILLTIVTIAINIYEIILKKKSDKLSLTYIGVSVVMVIIPYVIYNIF